MNRGEVGRRSRSKKALVVATLICSLGLALGTAAAGQASGGSIIG